MSHPDPPLFESPDVACAQDALKSVVNLLEDNRRIAVNTEKLRWLSIAITEVEKAGMCVTRALTMEGK